MRFKITKLDIKSGVDVKNKAWKKFSFQNAYDGKYYSAFDAPETNKFAEGYEFEADFKQKDKYKNIVWPKQVYGSKENTAQVFHDPSIHAKLDEILELLKRIIISNASPQIGAFIAKEFHDQEPEIPYQDSPAPSDEDAPF